MPRQTPTPRSPAWRRAGRSLLCLRRPPSPRAQAPLSRSERCRIVPRADVSPRVPPRRLCKSGPLRHQRPIRHRRNHAIRRAVANTERCLQASPNPPVSSRIQSETAGVAVFFRVPSHSPGCRRARRRGDGRLIADGCGIGAKQAALRVRDRGLQSGWREHRSGCPDSPREWENVRIPYVRRGPRVGADHRARDACWRRRPAVGPRLDAVRCVALRHSGTCGYARAHL